MKAFHYYVLGVMSFIEKFVTERSTNSDVGLTQQKNKKTKKQKKEVVSVEEKTRP